MKLGRRTTGLLTVCAVVSAACIDRILIGHGLALDPFDSTFVSVSTDFDADPLRPVELPAAEQQIGDLFYRASVRATGTTLDSGPMSLEIVVTVRNPAGQSVRLRVEGCTVWPRVFDVPARTGEPVWVPEGECMQASYWLSLPPASEQELSFLAYDHMLAGALPDGRYYFNAMFREPDRTVVLNAGSADVRFDVPGLEHRVELGFDPARHDAVLARVTLANRNAAPVSLRWGDCALGLWLYREPDRSGLPIWAGPPDYWCLRPAGQKLEPGESTQPRAFTRSFAVSDVLGKGGGLYYATVSAEYNSRKHEFPVGTIVLSR